MRLCNSASWTLYHGKKTQRGLLEHVALCFYKCVSSLCLDCLQGWCKSAQVIKHKGMLSKIFFIPSQQVLNLVHQIMEHIFALVLHNACGWTECTVSTFIPESDQCISFGNFFIFSWLIKSFPNIFHTVELFNLD